MRLMMKDDIFNNDPNGNRLFGHNKEFTSDDAWDWFIRGCPEGESKYIPGMIEKMKKDSNVGDNRDWKEE